MATDIVSAYRNVCLNLRGLKAYETIARSTLERQHNILFTGKADRLCHLRIDQQIPHYNGAVDEYTETMTAIRQLEQVKAQMEQIIGTMSELEQAVIVLSEQGKSLGDIAKLTNYSYIRVKQVSAKVRSIPSYTSEHGKVVV